MNKRINQFLLSFCLPLLYSIWGICAAGQDNAQSGESFFSTISQWLGIGKSEQPIIARLKPGPYQPSPLAVGSELDLARKNSDGVVLIPSEPLEAYLQRIRQRLTAASGVTEVPGSTRVVATSDFNATATPDGNILVAMSWLLFSESEDELAAVIAHELSHVLLHHFSADLISEAQERLNFMVEVGLAAKSRFEGGGVLGSKELRLAQQLSITKALTDSALIPAWSRGQEEDADLLAVDLLVKAGYSPTGAIVMLDRLRVWEESHQETDADFQKRLVETGMRDLRQGLELLVRRMRAQLGAKHGATKLRLEKVADYIDRFYQAEAERPLHREGWRAVASQKEVNEVLENYDRAFSAEISLRKGDIDKAHKFAKIANSGITQQHAYPNWVLGRCSLAKGDYAAARAAYQRAVQAGQPVRQLYEDMITLEESSGNLQRAIELVDLVQGKFGGSPTWYPRKIGLLKKAKRDQEAALLALKCSAEAPQLRRACLNAEGGKPPGNP